MFGGMKKANCKKCNSNYIYRSTDIVKRFRGYKKITKIVCMDCGNNVKTSGDVRKAIEKWNKKQERGL